MLFMSSTFVALKMAVVLSRNMQNQLCSRRNICVCKTVSRKMNSIKYQYGSLPLQQAWFNAALKFTCNTFEIFVGCIQSRVFLSPTRMAARIYGISVCFAEIPAISASDGVDPCEKRDVITSRNTANTHTHTHTKDPNLYLYQIRTRREQ